MLVYLGEEPLAEHHRAGDDQRAGRLFGAEQVAALRAHHRAPLAACRSSCDDAGLVSTEPDCQIATSAPKRFRIPPGGRAQRECGGIARALRAL